MTSRSHPDAPKVTSIHDAEGRLLRRTWPDGAVAESIELEELKRLWEGRDIRAAPRRQ